MADIVKVFLLKWLRTGQSREMAIAALGLLVILFGEEAGISAVSDPIAKLAVGLVVIGAIGGVVAMKYIDGLKPMTFSPTVTTGADTTVVVKGGGDAD